MKTAIVGSRSLQVAVDSFVPAQTTMLLTGGAKGIDTCVQSYAFSHKLPLQVIYPNYAAYGKSAPLIRDKEIVQRCDRLVAIWDGCSRGTVFTLLYAKKLHKPVRLYRLKPPENDR